MFFTRKEVKYRGYRIWLDDNIAWHREPVWAFQHDDVESEHDIRRGWESTLEDAKGVIDDIEAELNGSAAP